ncbi:hypothetical protein MACK_000045 [Theileria orientalis]|uniref:60S ribosomal protein L7 n=1 Tax=Theileria orientalis TaxID=68886 RepID=A0A976M966_THEOR|nr:hypothetical protein MACK_000045 [Theileria orientalis]
MEPLDGDIKKAETILRGHRIDIKKKSEIAKQIRQLKSKKKSLRDKNAIISLNTIFKRSKKIDLDNKRNESLNKKIKNKVNVKKNQDRKHSLLFVVKNYNKAESAVSNQHLKEIGLHKINTGRLMSDSPENQLILQKVFPFVYYGEISLKNLRDLLHKRGTIYDSEGLKLINNNLLVEDNFKNYNIYSLDELIDNIYYGLGNHEDILLKLGPISLSKLDPYKRHFDNRNKHGRVNINEILLDQ